MTAINRNLLADCASGLDATRSLLDLARTQLAGRLAPGGKLDNDALEREQFAAHGLAWLATLAEALAQMQDWGRRLDQSGQFGELEQLILTARLWRVSGPAECGIAMNQGEVVRPADLGVETLPIGFAAPGVARLKRDGRSPHLKARLAELIADGQNFGDPGFDDDMLPLIKDQFPRFTETEITPFAQGWHLEDQLIPLEVVTQMAELGVFGLTIPEVYGGLGMGKLTMCVVTEELSRGYIGVGSLGTRSEIAAN